MVENAASSLAMYVEINGDRFALELGQLYLFGKRLSTTATKGGSSKIVFNVEDADVDEKHCCLEVSVGEDVYVFDLFSSCGTFVNGDRLKPLEKTCVKHGDVMKLGALQSVRFYNEQLEVSHDSSGFGDNNKNTSDIIGSSPESTSQRDGRLKRFNSNNSDRFLVPAVPPPPKTLPRKSNSFLVPETEQLSTSRNSLGFNVSQNKSRNSDSFTIPETQYCGGRASIGSNLSLAESNADEEQNKSECSINNLGGNNSMDDDFCIPETQEFIPKGERLRSLKDSKAVNGLKTLEEKSVDLNDSDDDDNDLVGGSQFRISTQDYNEGFGEEDSNSLMNSQVIPIIKHTTVLLNGGSVKTTNVTTPQLEISARDSRRAAQEQDNELANINWSAPDKADGGVELKNLNSSTPDLFEFGALENARANANNNEGANGGNLFEQDPPTLEDEEDFMATQLFPVSNNNKPNDKDKVKPIKEKTIFSAKNDDQFLTLSDKENMQPDRLEPVTDLPPTQLFAPSHAAPSERSLASTSSRKSSVSKTTENKLNEPPHVVITPTTSNKDNTSALLHVTADDEDDILTQAFVQPQPKPASSKSLIHNYFNSTLLDDRAMGKNPASFFAEMETTPKKVQTVPDSSNVFKLPEKEFTSVRKTSSAASTASTTTVSSDYSDMDLLMCTPQLIREHMHYSKPDDLKKNILAAKNKKLFGDDTDEGDDFEDDRKSKDKCLVELINVPKDSKDFDKLLPHLKHDIDERHKRKIVLTEEQKAAKEAGKKFKFNISFGQEQEKGQKAGSGKSSTLSRDERHAARDKEKDVVQQKGEQKKLDRSFSNDKEQKRSNRNKRGEPKTEIKPKSKSSSTRKDKDREDNNKEAAEQKKTDKNPNKQKSSKEKKNDKEEPSQQQEISSRSKDAGKNPEKPLKTNGEKHEEPQHKKESHKKLTDTGEAANSNEEPQHKKQNHNKAKETVEAASSNAERPTGRRTRLQSADKPKEKTDAITKGPGRRMTRLKSSAEEKEKLSTNKGSIVASDDLDLVPTQPLMPKTRNRTRSRSSHNEFNEESNASSSATVGRNVPIRIRTRSRSVQKDSNEESDASNASSSRPLNRSSSRLNTSHSAFLIHENTAKTTTPVTSSISAVERKRKADIPVPQQNTERKRLKITTSISSSNSTASSSTTPTRRLISITMVDPERFNELNEKSKGLWAVAKDPADSEILVMDKSFRTFKFLLAMARGIPIVTSQWLKDVDGAKSLKKAPALSKYVFSDPEFEKKHKFCLAKSLQLVRDNKKGVLHGYEFVMTASIKPSPAEMKAIIEISGGIVHVKTPTAKDNQNIYLISSVDDRKDWHKYRRINANIVIVNTEGIMSAIMRQNCTPLSNHILA